MNEDGEEALNRELNFLDLVPVEYVVEMVTSFVFVVCMFICWRVLSNNPMLRRLGAGFGFFCLSFLVPVAIAAVGFLFGGEGESALQLWVSEAVFLVTFLVGTYYLVSGSRRLGRADADV